MKLNICKKFKIYTYKVKRKPTLKIFPMCRGYFENHRYIKIGVFDVVFWTKKPKKRKNLEIIGQNPDNGGFIVKEIK
jgi:hypothetical protein